MNLRWLKILLAALLTLVLVLMAAGFTVMHTETGATWVLNVARGQLEGLEIGSHKGSLHDGLELQEVDFTTPEYSLRADSLDLAVRTKWFPFVLRIEWLEVGNLVYQGLATVEETDPNSIPESFELPFPLEFPDIRLSGIEALDEWGGVLFKAQTLSASASADSQVRMHALELVVEQGRVTADGRIELREPFPLELNLEAGFAVPLDDEPEPLLVDIVVNAQGTLEGLEMDVHGAADPPGYLSHSFTAESRVSLSGMETARFEISGPDLYATGSGAVNWEESTARLKVVRLEIPGSGSEATADIAVDIEGEVIEGQVAWRNLAWPLRGEAVDWLSREGSVSISGKPDNWVVDGQADLEVTGYPRGQLRFDATGDPGGLEASIHEATVLGGRLHGHGAYRWDDGGAFTAELGLDNLATVSLAPDYPAVLSGELKASGRVEPLNISLDVRKLHGEALGRPLSASGRIEIGEGAIRAESFNIGSGASRFFLDGFPDEDNGLAFTANIVDLGDFLPDSRGSLTANGELFLRSGWPIMSLDARGSDIGWKNIHIASLTALGSNHDSGGADAFDITLTETHMGGAQIDQVEARLSIGAKHQAVSVEARSGPNQVSADLTGYLEHTGELPQAWNWTGELSALEIALSGQDTIRLQEPTGVQACPDSLRLDTACLAGTRGATACVEADWSSSAGVKAMAEARQWPLDVIGEMLGLELRISQQANGTVQMSFPQSGKPSGSADFRITAGAVGYTDDPEPILETGEGALAFTLTNGRLTSGVIDIPITGQGVIDVDFDITDVTMGLDSNLRGTLLIDLADLDILSAVLPKVDRVSGTLKTDLEISGTLGQPYFNGRFNLKDGMFENRISGLKLEAIELAGNLAENRKTRLTGSFRAAEGVGKLDALIDLRDIQQPWFKLDVVGEQLKLFNSEDLTVVVDPDFSVALQPGSVTIEGEILIPSALIAPTVIPEQTVGESPDLVITAGRPEGEEVEPEESQPISVLGGLRLALGNDVKLDLGVAELDLTGRVDFGWQGEVIPMANGRFNLSGEILAFGQLLEIARGDIGFPGVPADNPHLNIRAEREIYGNSEVRRAGLLIGGTVRRPVVEPYTDPMTNRDRAQTLLVTGSDFNMERGVGAVDIGTYIAPRIFVSYGVGVFDDENVVSIRYDLGSGWGVKATSGERQTGVDISFTVDN